MCKCTLQVEKFSDAIKMILSEQIRGSIIVTYTFVLCFLAPAGAGIPVCHFVVSLSVCTKDLYQSLNWSIIVSCLQGQILSRVSKFSQGFLKVL